MSSTRYPQVILKSLESGAFPALDAWYAVPLTSTQAEHLLVDVQQGLQESYLAGTEWFHGRVLEMIACYWLDRPVEHLYNSLETTANLAWQRALLALSYGQLLMSCRRNTAFCYLDKGFSRAVSLFAADSYFEVMNRHLLLRRLPLSSRPVAAASLDQLLTEARVIQKLGGRETWSFVLDTKHHDTVD